MLVNETNMPDAGTEGKAGLSRANGSFVVQICRSGSGSGSGS